MLRRDGAFEVVAALAPAFENPRIVAQSWKRCRPNVGVDGRGCELVELNVAVGIERQPIAVEIGPLTRDR